MSPLAAEAREWARKALRDRRLAEVALGAVPPLTDGAAFHCQQAAEKLIKAWMTIREVAFERVHDLGALVDQCAPIDSAWEAVRDAVEPLTAYAVRFRYPGPADPTVDEVRAALAGVAAVEVFVRSRLPAEVLTDLE